MADSRWQAWHGPYDQPDSFLARRLKVVQEQISLALSACPPGPIRAVNFCAGQGRDLLEVLREHPRGHEVRARLVELDPVDAAFAAWVVHGVGVRRGRVHRAGRRVLHGRLTSVRE